MLPNSTAPETVRDTGAMRTSPVLLFAHRFPGSAERCRELVAAGAGGFELDIQLGRRGVVVSHYLPFLQFHGWFQHDGTRFRWRDGPPYDPTLAEAVARVPPNVQLLLDPKESRRGRRQRLVEETAAALDGVDRARVAVSVSAADELSAYRAAGFRTWRTVRDERELRELLDSGAAGDHGASVRHSLLNETVLDQLRELVPTVVAWTVNDPGRARRLCRMGVDGITTDRIEVMAAARAAQ